MNSTQPGTRVITPAGRHGMISHPYTDDVGVRKAYVKIDGQDRKSVYLTSELRPEPQPGDAFTRHAMAEDLVRANPGYNLWHALNIVDNANPPTTTCSACGSPTRRGDHALCLARAERGLPVPPLGWQLECPCNDDRLHPERARAAAAASIDAEALYQGGYDGNE